MTISLPVARVREIATGLAFVTFPTVFIGAFAGHPNLIHPRLLDSRQIIERAHDQPLLQFGHVLVTLSVPLLVVAAMHFAGRLANSSGAKTPGGSPRGTWPGLIGGVLAVVGAVLLAADKGAFCLTMSALDHLPEAQFEAAMPALLAIFAKQGWLWIVWGILLLPVGFAIQGVALLTTGLLPRWQAISFLLGMCLIGVPDGLEIVNLTGAVLMTLGLLPYGIRLIRGL